jgi:hypothetical protein
VFGASAVARLCDLSLDPDADDLPTALSVDSNSGGGFKSCVLAANAMASSPYGLPNLENASLLEISLSCSGVGPVLGYVNSVRTTVCVRGADMEARDIDEGEVR